MTENAIAHSASDIEEWLTQHLKELLGIDHIDPTQSFDRLGLDSSIAISVTGSLGEYLGTHVQPTLMYDFPNIRALAAHLGS